MRRDLPSPDHTHALGVALGRTAEPDVVVALVGDLGAGKTKLSQGVGEGLGVRELVQSPTFVVVQEHASGRLPLHHADLYRVDDPLDVEQTGLEEMMEAGGVTLVEWADRHPHVLPDDHLLLTLLLHDDGRTVELEATGPRHAAWLQRALASLDGD